MVYVKTCPYCGTEFKTGDYRQIFCGMQCSNASRRKRVVTEEENFDQSLDWNRYYGKWDCPYQDHVGCYSRHCDKCGWNPVVAQARLDAYKAKED